MKKKVLWIEDNAFTDWAHYTGPVRATGLYDLKVSFTVSEAVALLLSVEYDAVVVDVRLEPGSDSSWRDLYRTRWEVERRSARLGIALLYLLLSQQNKPEDMKDITIGNIPGWVKAEKFGILTIEKKSEIQEDLNKLSISVYNYKSEEQDDFLLLRTIEAILK